MNDRRDAGQKGCGQEGCRTKKMQDRRGCRTGRDKNKNKNIYFHTFRHSLTWHYEDY